MFPFSTRHYIYDIETMGLDGKPCVFVGRRVLRPAVHFKPFRITLWKTVDIRELTDSEADELLEKKLKKYYEHFLTYHKNK